MSVDRSLRRAWRRPSRRQVLGGGFGLLAGAMAGTLLACGGSKSASKGSPGASSSGKTAEGTPKRGGRLQEHSPSAVNSLNPVANYFEGTNMSGVHVYDRLVSTRPGKDSAKEYVLEAAQTVEQPDATTVLFKLRPGMRFHDRAPVSGRAVTSDDIVKTQIYVRDNPRSYDSAFQNASMQSVEAPDAQTVVFKLKAPNAYLFSGSGFCNTTSQCIIPKELLDKFDTLDTAWQIGSGPYQLAEYELNSRYLYRRFEGFRDAGKGLPYIDERELRIITDPAGQEAAFRSGQVHLWTLPTVSLVDTLKRDMGPKVQVHEWPSLRMWTLSFNATRPPWNDARVREAMYRVINRQQYVDLLEQGRATICPGPLSLGLADYQLDAKQTEKYWRQDAKAAKQLLDAAGFPYDREIQMIGSNNNPRIQQSAEIFTQQVAPLGVKVRFSALPSSEFIGQRVSSGNWEMWTSQHPGYDTPQIPLRLQHTKTFNVHVYNGLKDPEVDKMIEKAEMTLDRKDQAREGDRGRADGEVSADAVPLQLYGLPGALGFRSRLRDQPRNESAHVPQRDVARSVEVSPRTRAQLFGVPAVPPACPIGIFCEGRSPPRSPGSARSGQIPLVTNSAAV